MRSVHSNSPDQPNVHRNTLLACPGRLDGPSPRHAPSFGSSKTLPQNWCSSTSATVLPDHWRQVPHPHLHLTRTKQVQPDAPPIHTPARRRSQCPHTPEKRRGGACVSIIKRSARRGHQPLLIIGLDVQISCAAPRPRRFPRYHSNLCFH